MPAAPPVAPPRLGDPLSVELAYRARSSANTQADRWNLVLHDDPLFGPSTGLKVGVAPTKNDAGDYELVWVSAHPQN